MSPTSEIPMYMVASCDGRAAREVVPGTAPSRTSPRAAAQMPAAGRRTTLITRRGRHADPGPVPTDLGRHPGRDHRAREPAGLDPGAVTPGSLDRSGAHRPA